MIIKSFPIILDKMLFSFSNLIKFTKILSNHPFLLKTLTSEKFLKINLHPYSVNLKNH